MAIAPTGAFYKALTFDSKSSRDYGVYITGRAVFNAPRRAVEMIAIPGRNGAFAQDQGRFENIEVTYPAGIFAETEEDFAQAISDFRNFLCSKKGYCRLTDEYNPDEYRMAVYKSGLEVDPARLIAGEFEITFECKPQRWLTSGEVATAVANGGTVSNPTLFESGPLLAIKGYGKIGFNGYQINLDNVVLGSVLLTEGDQSVDVTNSNNITRTFAKVSLLNTGDTITQEPITFKWRFFANNDPVIRTATVSSNSGITGSSASCTQVSRVTATVNIPALTFAKGTASSYTNTTVISGTRTGGTAYTAQLDLTVAYNGTNEISISWTITYSSAQIKTDKNNLSYGEITGDSTKSQLGNPSYIDCDLGDAYKIEGGEYVSLNQNVDLGSDLPKLAPGSNTVTFDNTITELKIEPRWWKV